MMKKDSRFRRIKNAAIFLLIILMVFTQAPASFAAQDAAPAGVPAEAGSEVSDHGGEDSGLSAEMPDEDPAGANSVSEDNSASEPMLQHTVSFVLPDDVGFALSGGSVIPSNLWVVQVADGSSVPLDQIPLLLEVPEDKLFRGWFLGAGTAPMDSDYIRTLSVTGNLTFTAAFEEAPIAALGLSPLGAPLAFNINAPLGGGTVTADTTSIHIYGEGIEQIFTPPTNNDAGRTTALVNAVAWLVTNGGGKDYVMYLPPTTATTATTWTATNANFAGLKDNVGTLVITGVEADPVKGALNPEPATAVAEAGYTTLSLATLNFGCNVILRNIRYTANSIYMNGHDLTLGHKSWATRATNYYGGAASGTVSGSPAMTVWSTGTGESMFVGGMQVGTLTGDTSITIHNTSGNTIQVRGGGVGTGTAAKAYVTGNVTNTINGMSSTAGGLGIFAGAGVYCDVAGTVTNTIRGPGRYADTSGGDWNGSYFAGGARNGNVGTDATLGATVISNNIDTSTWTNGRAAFSGANYEAGTIKGNIVNVLKAGTNNKGSYYIVVGGGGINCGIGGNWLSKFKVTANTTSLTITGADAAQTEAEDIASFKVYGDITTEVKSGCISEGSDNDRWYRGAGWGFYQGDVVSNIGTEGRAWCGDYNTHTYGTTTIATGHSSGFDMVGGGGANTNASNSMLIVGDTTLNTYDVVARWTYGGSFGGAQIGDSYRRHYGGVVDTCEGSGYESEIHIGDSRAEVYGGQVNWFLSGGGWADNYQVGDTSVEVYEAPRVGTQIFPIINASMGGTYGTGTHYISGDSNIIVHGGDFSGTARNTPSTGFSCGPSNNGYILGNATMTLDFRGNTNGFKTSADNVVSGGRRLDAASGTYLGAASSNTITLNVFADAGAGDLLNGLNIYGDAAASNTGNTRAGKITMNINAPGASIGNLYATNYSSIAGGVLTKDVNINLVSAGSVQGITSCGPSDNINKTIAAATANKAVISVGPQPEPVGWNSKPVAEGGQGQWPLEEFETVLAADGFPPRINVTTNGIRNFTSMSVRDRLITAQTGDIKNGRDATAALHGATYNNFGDVHLYDGSGLGIAGSGAFIIGKLTVDGLGYVVSPGGGNQVVVSDVNFTGANSRLEWLKTGSTAASNFAALSTWFGVDSGYSVITVNSTVGSDATAGKGNAYKFTPDTLTGRDMVTGKTYIGDSVVPSGNNNNGWGVCIPGSFYTWNVIPGSDGVSEGTIMYHMDGNINIDAAKPSGSYLDAYYSTGEMDQPGKSGSLAIPSAKMPDPVGYPKFTFTPDADLGEWVKAINIERSDHYITNPAGANDTLVPEQTEADYNDPAKSRVYVWQSAGGDKDYSFDITVDYTSLVELTASSVILKESDAKALVSDGGTPKSDADIIKAIRTATDVHGRPFLTDDINVSEAADKLGTPLAPGETSRIYGPVTYQTHETDGGTITLTKTVAIIVVSDDSVISDDGKAALTAADATMTITEARAITAQNGDATDKANIDWWTGASVVVLTEDGSGAPSVEEKTADLNAASTMVDAFKAVTAATEIGLDYSYTYGADKLERPVKARIHEGLLTSDLLTITKSAVNTRTRETLTSASDNRVGDILHFTLTATNPLPYSKWENVLFTDTLNANLQIVAGSVKINDVADAGNDSLISRPVGNGSTLDTANTRKLEFDAEIVGGYGTSFDNTFAVMGTTASGPVETSSDLSDDATFVTINVLKADPIKSIEKSHVLKTHAAGKTGEKYYVGDTITYTVAIENRQTNCSVWQVGDFTDDLKIGGKDVFGPPSNVQIAYDDGTDTLLTKDATADGYTYNSAVLTVPVGDLITKGSAGTHKKVTITFDVVILSAAAGTDIVNMAAVSDSGQPDVPDTTPLVVQESEPVPNIVKSVKNLTASADGRDTNKVGDTIEYSITVSNLAKEKSTWRSVLVKDVLDEALGISGTLASVEMAENGGTSVQVVSGDKYFGAGTDLELRTLYVKAGNIASGWSKTITFTVTLLPEAAGKTIPNIASAGGNTAGGEVPIDEVDPIKQLTKTHENLTAKREGRTDYRIGDEIEYTLTVANTEVNQSTWQNVVVTDDLTLGGTGFFDYDAALATVAVSGGIAKNPPTLTNEGLLTVELGDIPADTTRKITFTVVLSGGAAGQSVINIAKASPDMIAYDSFGNFTVQEAPPVPSLTKSVKNITAVGDSRDSNRVGDILEYTVEVANDAVNTSTWANITMTDIFDPGLDLSGTIASLTVLRGSTDLTSTVKGVSDLTGNTLTVPLGDIRSGEVYTITFRATIDQSAAGTTIKNTATADTLTKGTDTVTQEVPPVKFMEKTHENLTTKDGSYHVGDVVRYTVTLENQAAAKSSWHVVDVRDNLTLGQDAYDWTNTLKTLTVSYGTGVPITQDASVTDTGSHATAPNRGGKPTLNAGFLTVPVDDLIVNVGAGTASKVVLTFDVILKESTAGMTIKNKVVATPDSIEKEDGGGITVQKVDPVPLVLKSQKNLDAGLGAPTQLGDLIEYSIVVRNNATAASTWENVTVKDVLSDAYLTDGTLASVKIDGNDASAKASWDDSSSHHLSVDLGNIEYREYKTVTFEVEIVNPLSDLSLLPIRNTATATGDNGSGSSNETTLGINENLPDPDFSKTHTITDNSGKNDGKTHIGDTVHYTLTLKNKDTGLSTWSVGAVTDNLYLGQNGQAVFTAPYNVRIQYDANQPIPLTVGDPTNGYTYANGMLTVPVNDLLTGGGRTPSQAVITFDVDLTAAAAGQTIKNSAVAVGATGGEDDGDIDVAEADPVPDLQKSVSNGTALADGRTTNRVGDTLTYCITASNDATAASTWENVVITDALASGLDISGLDGTLTAVKKSGICPAGIPLNLQPGVGTNEGDYWLDGPNGRTLNINVGDIKDDEQVTLTFETVIDGSASGKQIKNTAVANSKSSDETKTSVEQLSPIKVFTKSHVNKSARADGNRLNTKIGDIVTYTLTLENTNPYQSVWEVETVIDDLRLGGADVFDTTNTASSARITYLKENGESVGAGTVAASAGATLGTDGKLYIPADKAKSLMVGYGAGTYSKMEITFDVTIADVAAGKTLRNIAVTNDGETAADDEGAGFTVDKAAPVKEAIKTVENLTSSDGKTRVGDRLHYTIAVSNKATANSLWTPVIVTDELSAHFDISETLRSLKINGTTAAQAGVTAGFGSTPADSHTLTVDLGSIANGDTKTITFDVVVLGSAAGEMIRNIAVVDGTETAEAGGGFQVESIDPVEALEKSVRNLTAIFENAGRTTHKVGDELEYTVTASNLAKEHSVWRDVVIEDPLHVALDISGTKDSVTLAGGTLSAGDVTLAGRTLCVKVGDIREGQSKTITFTVRILPEAAGVTITNTATVGGAEGSDDGTLDVQNPPEPPIPPTPIVDPPEPPTPPAPAPAPTPVVNPPMPRPPAPGPDPTPPAPAPDPAPVVDSPMPRPRPPLPEPVSTPPAPMPATASVVEPLPAPVPARDSVALPLPEPVTPEVSGPTFDLFGVEVPLYAKNGEGWAFINLILMLASILIALSALILRRRHFAPRSVSVLFALISVAVFFAAEDMSLRMALFNAWTISHAVLLALIIFLTTNSRSKKIVEEADAAAEAFPVG